MNAAMTYGFIAALGIAFAFLCFIVYSVLTAVPVERREYLDSPPAFFKLLWYPIRLIGFYIEPYIKQKTQDRIAKLITFAGYDYVFKPVNIIAAQAVFAVVFGLVSLVCLSLANMGLVFACGGAVYGFIYPPLWLKGEQKKRSLRFMKELPFFLDVITLCVEAGITLNGAMQQAVSKGPDGPVKAELSRAIRDIRSGMTRAEALRLVSSRINESSIKNLMSSIIQAENMGMNLGPILRIQSEQRRVERFLRAEKMAMEAPVKMLLPLVAFIFPCTFIVIGFPIYVMITEAFAK